MSRTHRGRSVLVVGGAGGMGAWFREALGATGWSVEVVDPAPVEAVPRFAALREAGDLDRFDFLVVAVPLDGMAGAIERLVERRPRGVVVEVASMQGHLAEALARAREAEVRVVALHPMFGPKKKMTEAPLRFLLAAQEEGDAEERAVERLLERLSGREVVKVPFARHDELMAWALGLAHLTTLVFGRALAECEVEAGALAGAASATFTRLSDAAHGVLGGSPDLYFDIQRLNPQREEVYAAARKALDELQTAVERGDREAFRGLFASARSAVGER